MAPSSALPSSGRVLEPPAVGADGARMRVAPRTIVQAPVVVAYAALLVVVLPGLPVGVPERAVHVLITAVTALAALTCWARMVRERRERVVWGLLALGLTGYAVGFALVLFVTAGEHGGPWGINVSDLASLLLYPASYGGLVALTRARAPRVGSAAMLDGGVVGLAAAGVAVALVAHAYPSLLQGSPWMAVYALAYPVGGATLLVVTLTGVAVAGWRLDATWRLLILGFLLMTVGDAAYGLQVAAHTFRFGTTVDALYLAGPVLVALAAWRSPPSAGRSHVTHVAPLALVVPGLASLAAVALLVADHLTALPLGAVLLAAGAIVLAVGRTALFLRQELHLAAARHEATTDALTGLANRRGLLAHVSARLAGEEGTALVLVDLDGFKAVNDALGHAAGDQLLEITAKRMVAAAAPALVARLGGDEFAVVSAEPEGAAGLAVRLRLAVEAPMVIDDCRVSVSGSTGRASTGGGLDAGELLRRADVALYRAKELRTGAEAWEPALDDGARDRLQLVSELRAAVAAGDQLLTWFQPKVEPTTRVLVGFEALVRWDHPRRGLLSPVDFLDAADLAGLLPQLTRQVLLQSLAHVRLHAAAGAPVTVAVNVGATDLLDRDLPAEIAALLAEHDLPASALRLEITETVVMSDPARIIATLAELRALGIALSLDDYGTGLSSLAQLRSLPVDELKIDRSFVRHLVTDRDSALIVSSTVQLAHALGLTVVAEGVEDDATLALLAEAGCDAVQGYLTGRPGPPSPPASPARGTVDEVRELAGV